MSAEKLSGMEKTARLRKLLRQREAEINLEKSGGVPEKCSTSASAFFMNGAIATRLIALGSLKMNALNASIAAVRRGPIKTGALNLLRRINDPEYMRYMSKEAVKKMERGRYEEWCRSRHE